MTNYDNLSMTFQGFRYVNLLNLCMAFLGTYGLDGYGDTVFGDTTYFFYTLLVMIKPTACLYCFLFTSWFRDISSGYVLGKRALIIYDCKIE